MRNSKLVPVGRTYIGWSGVARVGEPLTVMAHPQLIFRGDRFLVDSGLAGLWSISAFRVGMSALGISSSSLAPCELFTTRLDRMAELHALLIDSGKGDPTKGCVRIEINKPAEEFLGTELHVPIAFPGMIMAIELVQHTERTRGFVGHEIFFRAGMLGDEMAPPQGIA